MPKLWVLRGSYDALGWGPLERDARSSAADVLCFDRSAWALVRAPQAPSSYEGLTPEPAPAGVYLDEQGRPLYVADGTTVRTARDVIATLGEQAQALLQQLGDPELVLERLGRFY